MQVIARLGKEIDNETSVCYWAARNNIPIFCPALTDGSLGDMLYFHSYKSPGLVIDVVGDIRAINDEAIKADPRKTGILVLGGGEILSTWIDKHICSSIGLHLGNLNKLADSCKAYGRI